MAQLTDQQQNRPADAVRRGNKACLAVMASYALLFGIFAFLIIYFYVRS